MENLNESNRLDSVVIGAGQAGLAAGYWLKQDGRSFRILERGRVGETWRSQRWDSFTLNTPNWANVLPGLDYEGDQPDGFWTTDELIQYFERYVDVMDLPVQTGVTVTSVKRLSAGDGFVIHTTGGQSETIVSKSIVVASGILHRPKVPDLASKIPDGVAQLHACEYRSSDKLPDGAVVVVGGGQSGCQIVEDLIAAGRTVYFVTSKVARLPRRYRGREILEWFRDFGILDVGVNDLEDPSVQYDTQPQISGLGRYGHTVSLQQLEADGARLMGRLTDVRDGRLIADNALPDHVKFADEQSDKFKKAIDAGLENKGMALPSLDEDPADRPARPRLGADAPTELNLEEAKVSAVIWCTGFTADFSWLKLPVTDDHGQPIHRLGVAPEPGVYFLGFPWLRRRKSGIIYGVSDDARYVVSEITEYVRRAGRI